MGMTRQRQADREQRVHRAAINRALMRQLEREELKQGLKIDVDADEVITDEENISDVKSTTTATTFYDLCNELEHNAEKNEVGKHEQNTTQGLLGNSKEPGIAIITAHRQHT